MIVHFKVAKMNLKNDCGFSYAYEIWRKWFYAKGMCLEIFDRNKEEKQKIACEIHVI